jgi:hypothetical protein
LVGQYANTGRHLQPKAAPVKVNGHDLPTGVPKAIPYGVYDLAANDEFVSVGRPVRPGPRTGFVQTIRPGPVHPRCRLRRSRGGRTVPHPLVDRAGQRDKKATDGVGQTRNRLLKAVERTVTFGMLTQALVIIWYATAGYHPDDVHARRRAQPWYDSKTEPSFEDMLIKLRKSLIAARFSTVRPVNPTPRYCATTPWPAPQPPRNRETRVVILPTEVR